MTYWKLRLNYLKEEISPPPSITILREESDIDDDGSIDYTIVKHKVSDTCITLHKVQTDATDTVENIYGNLSGILCPRKEYHSTARNYKNKTVRTYKENSLKA